MAAAGDARPPGDGRHEVLAELGEWELIRRLGAFAPPQQFADDAALLAGSDASLVVNTDVLVDGLHFSEATTAAADVGWRAAAANLSDLAAMGATEVLGLTVGLVAPPTTPWLWVEGVYQGLSQALTAHGGVILGGDCSGGSQRLLAITAIGRLDPKAGAIRRADGRPGDLLVSTGCHGLSRLGLALLQRESITLTTDQPSPTADSTLGSRAIQAHRRPVPRFDAVVALMDSRPEGTPWRVGGCDSSDGLAAAVTAIAQASGCQAHLIKEALPIDPAMTPISQAVPWCLEGGEDFELVLALDPGWARSLCTVCAGATVIGTLEKGSAGRLCWSNGVPIFPGRPGTPGFRHFS